MDQVENTLVFGVLTPAEAAILTVLAVVALGAAWALRAEARARRAASEAAAERADALARTLGDALARVGETQAGLDGRLKGLSEGAADREALLRKALEERLDSVTRRVGATLTENMEKTGQALSTLHERLGLIDRAQKNIETLAGEVSDLQAVLSNKQRRGAFGEIQMQDLVRDALPAAVVEFQSTLSNGGRPDCLIRLPDPQGAIAVDAKFPLDAWRALAAAEDAPAREAALKQLRADVTRHVKAIADKYLLPGETADTALMFVPSEAVYATLHADCPEVVDASFKARVMIVSPTTFMATLHTMRAILRDARMREQAHVIQAEVGKLSDDVGRLDERVKALDKHFGQAGEDVRKIRISTEKVVKRADAIRDAELDDAPAALPDGNARPKTEERPSLALAPPSGGAL